MCLTVLFQMNKYKLFKPADISFPGRGFDFGIGGDI